MADRVAKYDKLAEEFAERSYANLHFEMLRRFIIVSTWGPPLCPGDSILELGCGDGYLAQIFLSHGFSYCGIDISPKMVAEAERRLQKAGLEANFIVADVNQVALTEPCDAIVAYMRTFFAYVHEPLALLERLRPNVRKKLIIDLNPRRGIPLKEALTVVQAAGFRSAVWRPFFVPKERRFSPWLLRLLTLCEDIPLVRVVPLQWKFNCLLMGNP